ncbi:hypothetical protein DEU56DRAFT_761338 [Suillus clintonianus]|uniref:uncharacterized protein n=1 Tax=Suillus clintonianus TaxID=1904413 RepID=UPI001B8673DF|nr:uncharacterized protein DEU56DRAFT_761338 [Suillus clintonianus]KAG2117599.1 hypothetical protein DEU56DRAFT_761338 [Suillus clintonianus]
MTQLTSVVVITHTFFQPEEKLKYRRVFILVCLMLRDQESSQWDGDVRAWRWGTSNHEMARSKDFRNLCCWAARWGMREGSGSGARFERERAGSVGVNVNVNRFKQDRAGATSVLSLYDREGTTLESVMSWLDRDLCFFAGPCSEAASSSSLCTRNACTGGDAGAGWSPSSMFDEVGVENDENHRVTGEYHDILVYLTDDSSKDIVTPVGVTVEAITTMKLVKAIFAIPARAEMRAFSLLP